MNNSHFNDNIEFKNFVDIPARSLIFLLKKLNLIDLFQTYVKDCRARKGVYSITSLLMVALEILFFRFRSKNDFYQNKKLGRPSTYGNLGRLAHIEKGRFPHSKTIDDAFWLLNPSNLEPILFDIFKFLRSSKLFENHPSLKKTVVIISQSMLLLLTLINHAANTLARLALIV
jgi:hypothetical protein